MKNLLFISLAVIVALGAFWLLRSNTTVHEEAATETPSQSDTVVTLNLGHDFPLTGPIHEAAVMFAQDVEKKSGGRLKIVVHPAQELGNAYAMLEMARAGTLDLLLIPTAKLSSAVPAMQYTDLPFLFPSREDAHALLDGEVGQMLLDKLLAVDLVGITFWEAGFKHFTCNKPLLSADDFIGTRFRIMKSPIIMEQFKSLGATPIPIDFFNAKRALKDGVIDGQENPLTAIVEMGFYEVQSDLTLSTHAYLNYALSISAKTFNSLSADMSRVLMESARAITPLERENCKNREQILLDKLKQAGMRIHPLDDTQREAFAAKTSHIVKQFEEEIGPDILSKAEELLYLRHRPAEGERPIVIGIDADLSLGGKDAGLSIKRGVELAINEINAKGGLLGKQVTVMAKDHQASSIKGVANISELVSLPEVVGVIGGKHSAVIAAEMASVKKANLPYLIPWAAASEIVEEGVASPFFRVSISDDYAARYLAEYTLSRHKNPFVIAENSLWGRGAMEKVQRHLQHAGIISPLGAIINRGQSHFEEIIQNIRTSGADSIILVLNLLEGSRFVQSLANYDSQLPIVSHWGVADRTFFEENRDYLKHIDFKLLQSFSLKDSKSAQAKMLKKAYYDIYGNGKPVPIPLPSAISQAYDATHLLLMAIRKAGTTERARVRDALEHLPAYDGVLKRYNPAFSAKRHEALDENNLFMAVYGEDGSIIPVK